MAWLDMNTYIYAPKDDLKHRLHWRDLYTVDEAGISLLAAVSLNCYHQSYLITLGFSLQYFHLVYASNFAVMLKTGKELYALFMQQRISVFVLL